MNLKELMFLKAASGGREGFITRKVKGNPATFTTNVAKELKSLTVPLACTQSGSGDPYSAGGGPNLLDPSKVSVKGNTSDHYGIEVIYEDGVFTFSGTSIVPSTNVAFEFMKYTGYSLSGKSYYVQAFDITGTGTSCFESVYGFRASNERSASIVFDFSSIQTINIQLKMSVSETEQSGFSPYENIRPITGINSFRVDDNGSYLDKSFPALGKNLFDKSTGIELTGANILVARHDGYGVPFHMTAGTTYIIYTNSSTKPNEITLRVPLSTTTIAIAYTQNTGYMTYTPEEDVDVAFNAYWVNGRPEDATDLMIETGSKTSYEPYNNFVYGGTFDMISGKLTMTDALIESYNGETLPSTWISDRDVYSAGSTPTIGAQVVYKLATPIEKNITPSQISAISGENTISANVSGDLTVVYYKKK